MLKLYFNYQDVFRAARLGLSPKKLWVLSCGLVLGFIGHGIFGYLAHLASGRSLADTWAIFGLIPLPWGDFGAGAWLLWGMGALLFLLCYLMAATIVAKITTEQLQGNEFLEVGEGVAFVRRNWKSVVGGPLVLVLFCVMILIGGLALGLWGRIPVVGEWTVALLSIPAYFVCLFLAFLLAALVVGIFYAPAIIGATKSDTFDSLFETFSCMTGQPWRLVVYSGLLKLVAAAGALVFGLFTAAALGLAFKTLAFAMGPKFVDIAIAAVANYTPGWVLNLMIKCSAGAMPFQYLAVAPDLSWSGQVAAFIMGMSINLVRVLVLAYLLSTWVAGQTIIYGILVMKRDERNIFIKPEEKETPPAEAPTEPACEKKKK